MSLRDDVLDPDGDGRHDAIDSTLTIFAQAKNKRVKSWLSIVTNHNSRDYYCNICGGAIDSDSNRWPATKHAYSSVRMHREKHTEQLAKSGKPRKTSEFYERSLPHFPVNI